MAIIDKIEKTATGQIVLKDSADNIIRTDPPELSQRMWRTGAPDAGVALMKAGEQIAVIPAADVTRIQVYPDPEQSVSLNPQQLAETLVNFFFS